MRIALLLSLFVLAAVAAAVALLVPARAEERATLYIDGLSVGKRQKAFVRIHNPAPTRADDIQLNYTIRHAESGQPLSLPGAGSGARIEAGRTLELDLGAIIAAYRLQLGAPGNFEGEVQFVAISDGGILRPFGPESIQVEAVQQVGSRRFRAEPSWIREE